MLNIYMKHQILILLLCFFFWACNKKQNPSESKENDQVSHKNEAQIKIEKKDFKGDDFSLSYSILIEGSENLKAKIHPLLFSKILGEQYKSLNELENAIQNKSFKVSDEHCPNASWDFHSNISQLGSVVSLEMNESSFFCGAHPNSYSSVHHFHAISGDTITLNDIFIDLNKITELAENQFCTDNKLKKGNKFYLDAGYESFGNGFFLSKNYAFDKSGIVFIYNRYEAGPYTLPPFDVKISFEQLKPFLKPNNVLGI